jgi:hypothetical protein
MKSEWSILNFVSSVDIFGNNIVGSSVSVNIILVVSVSDFSVQISLLTLYSRRRSLLL